MDLLYCNNGAGERQRRWRLLLLACELPGLISTSNVRSPRDRGRGRQARKSEQISGFYHTAATAFRPATAVSRSTHDRVGLNARFAVPDYAIRRRRHTALF